MDIQDFIYLEAVEKYSNVTHAAKSLYITQSALSQAIKSMEEELGFVLVERKKSPAVFTDRGKIVIADAKRILAEYYMMQKKWVDMKNWECGHFTLGISETYNRFYLTKILPAFLQTYPHMRMDTIEATSDVLEDSLYRGALDVSIFSLPLKNRLLEYTPLFEEEILLAIPCNHPLAEDVDETNCDLSLFRKEDFILIKEGQRLNGICLDILKSFHIVPNVRFETRSVETVAAFVNQNMGVGFVPEAILSRPLPNVKYCRIHHPLAKRLFVAAYTKKELLSPWAKRFVEFVKGK